MGDVGISELALETSYNAEVAKRNKLEVVWTVIEAMGICWRLSLGGYMREQCIHN